MASRLAVIARLPFEVTDSNDLAFLLDVARAASEVRMAQKAYYKSAPGVDKRSLLIDSKTKEAALDKLLCEPARPYEPKPLFEDDDV